MTTRLLNKRLSESTNIWPGFVDVLATLLIVIIFVLMIFTVSQIYLSDAISGKDKALEDLRKQIQALSSILIAETKEKQEVLKSLDDTESELKVEKNLNLELETDIRKKNFTLSEQNKNIQILSSQIESLLNELKIVANALEMYEGADVTKLKTEGLGERINLALAGRIEELNTLNRNLMAINESLGLEDAGLIEQLEAINKKNSELIELNNKIIINEEELQKQVIEYQKLTKDLIAINESLGIEDASLSEQLEAIKNKNTRLTKLNQNLIERDSTIFDLRGKISELNNILSISNKTELEQKNKILNLSEKLTLAESDILKLEETSNISIIESEKQAVRAIEEVGTLSNQIDILKNEIAILNNALEASEQSVLTKELKIEVLGDKLNKALTSKVFELQKYRSEFFGRLQSILGDRKDIKIVGDRFIFESELLFDSGSANLQIAGKEKLKQIGLTLKETTKEIPNNIDWIIQVEGHTDIRPIQTVEFPSNWELSTARANSVLKLLLDLGFQPNRLSAAGYGEFYPIAEGNTSIDLQQNRRIELKLTSR